MFRETLDKIMAVISNGLTKFFDWWGDLTGLGTSVYFDGKLSVNWKTISVGLIILAAMILFLPGGLLY